MENKQKHIIQGVWANVCRFVLAVVFTFSGFVKAVDPLGFQYKVQDYIEAFGLTAIIPSFLSLFGSIALAVIEFSVGIFLFFGIRRKLSTIFVFLMMSFMTPLTLYLAIANPVSDCGCFGEAVILTNWETFWKNMILLIAAISVFKWGNRIVRFVSPSSQWLVVLYTFFFILGVSFYCLRNLPIFDFRPYKNGTNILQDMSIPENAKRSVYETIFILEKDGVEQEFTLDNYPDSIWTFVDSKSILKERGYEPPITDFSIKTLEDYEDITEEILNDQGYTFLLIAHRIEMANDANIDLINEIYDYSIDNGYKFYCLTSSPDEYIEQWKDRTGAEYPFCLSDDITLKTIIRSNPGLLLLKDGEILNKWNSRKLPDEYDLTDSLDKLELGKPHLVSGWYTIGLVLIWFVVPLLLVLGVDVFLVKRSARLRRKKEIN